MNPAPDSEGDARVALDVIERAVAAVLERHGLPAAEAATAARALVRSEAEGAASHGLLRLPALLACLRAGTIAPVAKLEVVSDLGALALCEAGAGVGPVVAARAAQDAAARAGRHGVGVTVVRNSSHCGRLGHVAQQVAAHGLIGVAASNASPRLVPAAGARPAVGVNPLALAAPGPDEPLVIDLSPGVVAAGKIRAAHLHGEPIPEGWALGPDGASTTDPGAALRGAVMGLGGHKGWALGMAVDVVTGVLGGGPAGPDVGGLDAPHARQGTSHVVIALDPAVGGTREAFADRLARYRAAQRARLPPGGRLPGEGSAAALDRARRAGLRVTPALQAVVDRELADAGLDGIAWEPWAAAPQEVSSR